jgi:hypothetical protein
MSNLHRLTSYILLCSWFQFAPPTYNWIECQVIVKVKVKVKLTLWLMVSQSVSLGVKPHLGSWPDMYYCLTVMVLFCGAPSLTRWWVCLLYTYMLLALASIVFLGSKSLGTCDHILLSQIWDFPSRHLLQLAITVEYLTAPPHGQLNVTAFTYLISLWCRHVQKRQFCCCLRKPTQRKINVTPSDHLHWCAVA